MELIKETNYYKAFYDKDKNLLEIEWQEQVLELDEDEYKDVLYEVHQLLFNYPTKYILHNAQNFVYPFTQELNNWIKEHITKAILEKVGVKRVAYIFPKDYLTKVGLELLIDRVQALSPFIIRRFFSNREEALNWLLN